MEIIERTQAKAGLNTRKAILKAAQGAFSTRGYSDTGVRDITAQAGVSIALVNRYFGSKEKLLEEALTDFLDSRRITAVSRERFGVVITEQLLDTDENRNPLSLAMLASSDPKARAITHRLIGELIYEPLALWFGPERGRQRAARLLIIMAGVTFHYRIYPLDVLAPQIDPSLRDWLVSQFQALADGDDS